MPLCYVDVSDTGHLDPLRKTSSSRRPPVRACIHGAAPAFPSSRHRPYIVRIDRDGGVVTNEDLGNFANLPVVVGEGAPEHARTLLDELEKYPGLQSHVVAAVRVGDRRWNLHLKSGADVLLPEGEEAAALQRLKQLQATDALLERKLAVIDMRLPDRLVVRPAADSHPDQQDGKRPST